MHRTIRRQPFSVSTASNAYPTTQTFTQVEFKGLCDKKNDVAVENTTFADVKNVYTDDNGLLVSRPPFKFLDGEGYIVDEWYFGDHGLRLHRLLFHKLGDGFAQIDSPREYDEHELYFGFVLRCITHDTIDTNDKMSQLVWVVPVSEMGWEMVPEIFLVPVEDKIFIWFAGIEFYALNLTPIIQDAKNYLYFEDATKYLYYPVNELVVNGLTSELEDKSILTDTYRKRHQYSALSSVDFGKLIDKEMSVSLYSTAAKDNREHLYDITVGESQEKMLIYPYAPVGNDYYIDVVQGARSLVILRYHLARKTIEVSFDGKYYQALPRLDNIIGKPLLTKDGFHVVAFTQTNIAYCQLVSQSTDDSLLTFLWLKKPYAEKATLNGQSVTFSNFHPSYVPTGYFETIEQFAYVFFAESLYENVAAAWLPYVYTEWSSGSNAQSMYAFQPLLITNALSGDTFPLLVSDDIRVHARYTGALVEQSGLGMIVGLLCSKGVGLSGMTFRERDNIFVELCFEKNTDADRVLQSNDEIRLVETVVNTKTAISDKYVTRLNSGDGTISDEHDIVDGDLILITRTPLTIFDAENYDVSHRYEMGEYVRYLNTIYQATRTVIGITPSTTNDDWREVADYYTKTTVLDVVDDEVVTYDIKMPTKAYLFLYDSARYRINGGGGILNNASVTLSLQSGFTYSWEYLRSLGGEILNITTNANHRWDTLFPNGRTAKDFPKSFKVATEYSARLVIYGVDNPAKCMHTSTVSLEGNGTAKMASMRQMDLQISVPVVIDGDIAYDIIVAYALDFTSGRLGHREMFMKEQTHGYFANNRTITILLTEGHSSSFRIMANTEDVVTDTGIYLNAFAENRTYIPRPENGALYPIVNESRVVSNGDELAILLEKGDKIISYQRNIHKVDSQFRLTSGVINSGDIVAYSAGATTEQEYLSPTVVWDGTLGHNEVRSPYFSISRLISGPDGNLSVGDGPIKNGDIVMLQAYDKELVLPKGHPGNIMLDEWLIEPWEYPTAPSNWDGLTWPFDDIPRFDWNPGDPLPTGPVTFYGIANIMKNVMPLSFDVNGVWYNIDGSLWTSQRSTENIIELDEYVNCNIQKEVDEHGQTHLTYFVSANLTPPDFHKTLNEHYIAYDKMLYVSEQRQRDNDYLLYLPRRNEQRFTNKISNLHPLSDTEMGVFTETQLWYIRTIVADDGIVSYTKPMLSKTPIGCHYGDDVVTALDGQAVILATPRGITAFAPQDFIATTEKSLTYLSDAIQETYNDFYHNDVSVAALVPNEFEHLCPSQVKIKTYRHWLLFYKYMDNTILALDTRDGGWWSWTTPYPIKSLSVGSRLHVLMQIDYSPVESLSSAMIPTIVRPTKNAPLLGVSFLFTDREVSIVTDDEDFPELVETPIFNIGYHDDIVPGTLCGISKLIYENEYVGYRRQLSQASSVIDWFITSQKLHLNQINNYKAVKGMSLVVKGDKTFTAKLSTKAIRDITHPEQSSIIEVRVNDVRTFVKPMNLMHIIDFQYKLENDSNAETPSQLRLNALTVKYEVKEKIR